MLLFLKNLFRPAEDFAKLVKDGAVIVDVRTKGEFQAGHILGSKNIPLDGVKTKVQHLKKLAKPFIPVCRSGSRSVMANSIFSSAGINVYNGGAWTSLKRQIQ